MTGCQTYKQTGRRTDNKCLTCEDDTLGKKSKSQPTTTVCPRSSDPFYIVSYYKKWVTTSWTHSSQNIFKLQS